MSELEIWAYNASVSEIRNEIVVKSLNPSATGLYRRQKTGTLARKNMRSVTRRTFIGVTATGIGGLWLGNPREFPASPPAGSPVIESLYRSFQDPDRKYSIRPFWFWNGKLDGEELSRQIRQMVENGVYGAYAHNRDGLATPYLSEEWWQAVGAALKTSREAGFSLCMVDEFEWPSGEARDYWLPGINKSRVVAANPDFRMRQLRPIERKVRGPQRAEVALKERTALVVAGRQLGPDRIEGNSLTKLAFDAGTKSLSWDVPTGDWLLTAYVLEPTYGLDGGTVDLMNPQRELFQQPAKSLARSPPCA